MIIDLKSHFSESSHPEASTSDRKLSIELPPRKIYTSGTAVTGIVHLGKELERIQEIQISLVCVVFSMHHRYYGNLSHDIRRETTKLIHRDMTLWTASDGNSSIPPADIPFDILIPDVGNDRRGKDPNTPLPPSFHAGKRRGWRNTFTYGTPIGHIKYRVKVAVMKKGTLTRNERSSCPFIFLPPSPPPSLLPSLPDPLPDGRLDLPEDLCGQARLQLWIPQVTGFPRLTPIPFVLCLTLQSRHVEETNGRPPEDVLPPAPQLDKAAMHLRQTIHSFARRGRQKHVNTLKAAPTDNMLYGIVPEEGQWKVKTSDDGDGGKHWEKQLLWRGLWIVKETPNFVNRQLSWEYALVAEIPIKGPGNEAKLVSRPLEVTSGIAAGTSFAPSSEDDMLDLPPDYFANDGSANDEDDEKDEDDENDVGDEKL